MIAGQIRGDLGFSLNPVKLVKSAAKGVAKGVTYAGKAGVAVAKNSTIQRAASTFVPGGAQAVAAINTARGLIPGGGSKAAQAPAPGGDGTTDLGPTQDAAAAAQAPAAPAGGMVTLPGIGAVPRKTAIIGGAVLGGLVLVLLLRK